MSAGDKEPCKTLIWSENIFKEIVYKEYFTSAVKDLSVQKDIITRFFEFYLGGRVQKGLRAEDLVFGVLSMLPINPYAEEVVWPSLMYRDDGKAFFLTPQERQVPDVRIEIDSTVDVQRSTEETNEIPEQKCANDAENTLTPNSIVNFELNSLFEWFEFDLDDDSDYNKEELFTEALHQSEGDESQNANLHELLTNNDKSTNEMIIDDSNHNNVSKNVVNEIEQKLNCFINGFPNDKTSQPIQKEHQIIYYGPVENAAFITCCDKLLSLWDTDSSSRTVLKSFFGVVALVLMRATTKSYKHLFSTFHGEKFLRLLRHSIQSGFKHYCPPHKRCLKRAYRTFSRRDGRTPTMFAKLVAFVISNRPNKYLKYVINNGLLNYTADYGFNLIRLLRNVCRVHGDMARVLRATLCEATEVSWKKVSAFLSMYCASSSTDGFVLSYRWARVLDGRFFKDVSCQQNYGLAVIFTVFLEKISGVSGVWQATWVENDDLEKYRELGNKLYERYESMNGGDGV